MKKKKTDFEELMKNVDYTRWLQALIPVMQPVIIFGAWLGFSMIDKKASIVSKIIAIAEPIPTIDLNVPKPVVLASLYHSTDIALEILADVIKFLQDIEIPSAEEIVEEVKEEVEEIKEEVEEKIVDVVDDILQPTSIEFQTELAKCVINAKESLPFGTYYILGPAWILSCMTQKGFKVTLKYIKDKLFG